MARHPLRRVIKGTVMKLTRMKWMMVVVLTAVFLTVGLVLAGGDMMPRSLVSSGGGIVNQNGVTLHSAVGQPAVGAVANGDVLCAGYLCGADAPPVTVGSQAIYLPFVMR